jgi:hypothetical protein
LKTEPVGFPETSAANYQSVLRNIPEEGRPHLHRGGSPKSHSSIADVIVFVILRLFFVFLYTLVYLCWLYTAEKPAQT